MKKNLLILIIIIPFNFINAQVYDTEIPNNFFNILKQTDITLGIDYLYSTNEWLKKDVATKEELKQSCEKYFSEEKVGKYIGHHLITRNIMRRTLAYSSYMVNYDKKPYRFVFVLYRPTH